MPDIFLQIKAGYLDRPDHFKKEMLTNIRTRYFHSFISHQEHLYKTLIAGCFRRLKITRLTYQDRTNLTHVPDFSGSARKIEALQKTGAHNSIAGTIKKQLEILLSVLYCLDRTCGFHY